MKTKYFIPLLLLAQWSCEKDNSMSEVPANVFELKPCETLESNILYLFPEGKSVLTTNLEFFADTIQKKILLTKDCEVYVSYITEGASYRNTLGWYAYNISQPPLTESDIVKNVLFPNISGKSEGGELETGYTVQLGTDTFAAGTVIGFFLIVDGWEDGSINYSKPTHYTNWEFNIDGKQQHVLYKESKCHAIVFGFEDLPDNSGSDRDFNDIIFILDDNRNGYETTSFDLSKVIIK